MSFSDVSLIPPRQLVAFASCFLAQRCRRVCPRRDAPRLAATAPRPPGLGSRRGAGCSRLPAPQRPGSEPRGTSRLPGPVKGTPRRGRRCGSEAVPGPGGPLPPGSCTPAPCAQRLPPRLLRGVPQALPSPPARRQQRSGRRLPRSSALCALSPRDPAVTCRRTRPDPDPAAGPPPPDPPAPGGGASLRARSPPPPLP